jgi:RNA polymerase sigma-70 factor (ECF subfamily)
MAGVAINDTAASEELVGRFQRRVYGAALAVVRDPALAEEVAQDTFVRAWRHAQAYDARRGSLGAWLMRITHNLAVDALRVRRPSPVDPVGLIDLVDPSREQRSSEAAAEARELLAHLPVEQARALVLAAFYGHTANEVAVIESVPLGTAKTRIRLGLARVRANVVDMEEQP